jgi:heat shock protein HslJ
MMRRRLTLGPAAVTAVAAAVVLAGCTADSAAPPSAKSTAAASAPSVAPLPAETEWRLEGVKAGMLDDAVVRDELGETTLELSGAREARGTAGCRTFEADYEIVDDDLVQVTRLDVDESGCAASYPAIGSFTSFVTMQRLRATLDGDVLSLATLDGAYALVFGAVE